MGKKIKELKKEQSADRVYFKHFSIVVKAEKEVDEFINELETLCKKYAVGDSWYINFKVEG